MNHALIEKQRADSARWVQEQTANCIYINDLEDSPCNAERQVGKSLSVADFEAKLRKLNPDFIFETHVHNPTKRSVYLTVGAEKKHLCVYENSYMPEHSIRAYKEEEVWDRVTTHIDRRDLPEHEVTPEGVVWHGPLPGYTKVNQPWHEAIRGWRTVLLHLVGQFIVTPAQVEAVFGTDNTAEWKGHMGHGEIITPW